MTEAETIDLVARAAAGDGEAFDLLVRGHHSLVFRWALVVAEDADDAEDLAQAVWIKAHHNLGGYRGEAKFTSWLYRITFNTAVEFGRKRQRRSIAMRSVSLNRSGDAAPAPGSDAMDAQQLVTVVRVLLAELPPRQRAVFVLADLEDRSTAEIAEMLDIEETTVRVTLFKARRAIRARMLAKQPRLVEEYRS